MKAYIFPGQGAQFTGMGLDLYEKHPLAQELFESANEILDFSITDIMFEGTADDLKETKVTQPAIFLHSVILSKVLGNNFRSEEHTSELQSRENLVCRLLLEKKKKLKNKRGYKVILKKKIYMCMDPTSHTTA